MSKPGRSAVGAAPMGIEKGDPLVATTATGERIDVIAMARPVRGRDFPLIWVATKPEDVASPEYWLPWPLDAVEVGADE